MPATPPSASRGRVRGPRAGRRPGAPPGGRGRTSGGSPQPDPPRPRLTGRAFVLVLVVLVLLVSYASSMRAWVDQRRQIAALEESIATAQRNIAELQREKRRWNDKAYVMAQARERFGYVLPGEVGYQVLDGDGRPLERGDGLDDPSSVGPAAEPVWWQNAWASMEAAGNPQDVPVPATELEAPRKQRLP